MPIVPFLDGIGAGGIGLVGGGDRRDAGAMPTASPLRDLSPNWFASVMGTGIVANAAVLLPAPIPGLRVLAAAAWVAAAALLAVGIALTAIQGRRDPGRLRRHLHDRAMAPFFGMPAMALLTVGAGALLVGRDVIGLALALDVAATLWVLGTLVGLAAFVVVPATMAARHRPGLRDVQPTWLLPVVGPMVSAATGAGLIAHLPTAGARLALLLACGALFAVSAVASAAVIALVVVRLHRHGIGEARLVPTLWIVLGPLGQSITAANLLAAAATGAGLPAAGALGTGALVYSLPVGAGALAWLSFAATVTGRTARTGLPFSLTWWSFTFPVGTCVTGASALAVHATAEPFTAVAIALFALLLAAWATTATRTARGLRPADRPRRRPIAPVAEPGS
jgi:tellurite resistance protein TehA-like permease